MATTKAATVGPIDMKLEVVMIGVSDIDLAKAFYENLGWRFDGDFRAGDDFRIVQMTPHNSGASIIFGKGIRTPAATSPRSPAVASPRAWHPLGPCWATPSG